MGSSRKTKMVENLSIQPIITDTIVLQYKDEPRSFLIFNKSQFARIGRLAEKEGYTLKEVFNIIYISQKELQVMVKLNLADYCEDEDLIEMEK